MPYYDLKTWVKQIDFTGIRIRLVNCEGYIYNHLAKQISIALQGRDKPIYHPEGDFGDVVVCVNTDGLVFENQHELDTRYYRWQNKYRRHVEMTAREFLRLYGSEGLLKREVHGHIPRDQLKKCRMRKVLTYPGPYHDFDEKFLHTWTPPIAPWQPSGGKWDLPPDFQPMNQYMFALRSNITEPKSKVVHFVPPNAYPSTPKVRQRERVQPNNFPGRFNVRHA